MSSPPLLSLRGVEKRFRLPGGEAVALAGVTFDLAAGELAVVTGPSGSGKSTLLHLATLLDQPTDGKLLFDGADAGALPDAERGELRKRAIGVVFQGYHLMPSWTVLDNVLLRFRYTRTRPEAARRASLDALERTGMAAFAARPAGLLSGGEMQRVAIARALAVPPRLLAADEPTGNLDAESAASVMSCLRELNRDGAAVLLATHDVDLLPRGTRRIAFRRARIESDGPLL